MCYSKPLAQMSEAAKESCLRTLGGHFGFDPEVFRRGCLQGTMFWLPLRREPSALSSSLYSREKVGHLFHAFRAEAPSLLLFLRKVRALC